ncbi:MAG TPA: acyl-CoA dehydrogenase [Rhodanobacteraceae bacterium]|nr:acyl-CoA dehydrogenase [Rhodanobacteraceae bacterium]
MTMWIALVLALALALTLAFAGRGWLAWVAGVAVLLGGGALSGAANAGWFVASLVVAVALAVLTGWPPLRRALLSRHLLPSLARALPKLGDTERVALEAGTVWWDGELFSGMPDWRKLLDFSCRPLDPREQAFLDGPVDRLCQMLDDWQVEQQRGLSPEVWDYLKREGFFGMIIPREYGGLAFSQIGHARVVTRIASRSITAAVTVMVPNSLGPAELLLHYGTDEQKRHYLPRLAVGAEIPCFALTGPEAGSDAAATQSTGVVERGQWQGQQVLGLRLNWNKRYITLAPVATLIGLAFRLKDPHGLLGDREDRGITCALIPRELSGIEIGRHHDPMGVPFDNGPTQGHDVFVPLEAIIGGREQIGQGWRMLMESLAAGRSISLPALSIGAAQMATRIVGAYATVREQFDTPIGRFEGVEEPLARIAGMTYLMSATRTLTCGALDAGEKPAVLGNIAKAYLTEAMREVVADAMDIRAGSAIQRGPRNLLARMWMAVPIGITVEGANILTRSMIIYGQGAIRCHPWVHKLITAVDRKDRAGFDRALFGYVNFVVTRGVRAWLLGLSGARLARVPAAADLGRQYQHLSRFSAAFAFLSDIAMGTLGGSLKRREKISGRMADVLAWLYIASATLKRYHDEPKLASNYDLARWGVALALYRIQQALLGILDNLPSRGAAWLARWVIFPLGPRFRPPSDALGRRVARAILEDREARRNLTPDIFVPPPDEPGLGRLEAALDQAVRALPIEAKLRDAVRDGRLERVPGDLLDDLGLAAGILTEQEYQQLDDARSARDEEVQVDSFSAEEYKALH